MTWLDGCYPANRRAFARLVEREKAEGSAKKVDGDEKAMKKAGWVLIAFFLICFAAGCGADNGESADPFDLYSETTQIFGTDAGEEIREQLGEQFVGSAALLGMQFYQGEPVQIWGGWKRNSDKSVTTNIYLFRQGRAAELWMEGLPQDVRYHDAMLDEEGCLYSKEKDTILKYDKKGNLIYKAKFSDISFFDMCRISDETAALFGIYDETHEAGIWWMDMETGDFSAVEWKETLGVSSYLGTGESGLLVMDWDGVWEIDIKEGKKNMVLPFLQTSFSLSERDDLSRGTTMWDFRMTGEGDIKMLWSDGQGRGSLEILRKTHPAEGKKEIVIRGLYVNNGRLKEQIAEFNKKNEDYYVRIEACGDGTDEEDFITQTSVQLAVGKGPDILYGDALTESVYSLIRKGIFEDQKPYMDASGIKEEDYFKGAFDCFRLEDQIYGIRTTMDAYCELADRDVVGDGEAGVEGVLDALLAYGEKAVYMRNVSSEEIMRNFLQGSESLWGMIDWETGTFDADEAFLIKLLNVAKRYGDDGRNTYPPIAEYQSDYFYNFKDSARLEEEGKVLSGYWFDDGCHGITSTDTIMMVNANSGNKEGAWEFIRFLLSEETQHSLEIYNTPVSKSAFAAQAQKEIEEGAVVEIQGVTGKVRKMIKGDEDLTEEKAQEIEAFLEDARALPIRTVPILDIICEESRDYFDGSKSAEDVIKVIKNRVSLYTQE